MLISKMILTHRIEDQYLFIAKLNSSWQVKLICASFKPDYNGGWRERAMKRKTGKFPIVDKMVKIEIWPRPSQFESPDIVHFRAG